MTDWVEQMACAAQSEDRYRHASFILTDPRSFLLNDELLLSQLTDRLTANGGALAAWALYSVDKRWSPSPYLDGHEVGLYDGGYCDVEHFNDLAMAAAAFILRERDWLLLR